MTTRTRVRLVALVASALLSAWIWQPAPAAAKPRGVSVKSVSAEIADGVRDVAYSAAADTLWATVGTGDPITSAALLALDPFQLTTTASYPAPTPRPPMGEPARPQELAAIVVDDSHGDVWMTSPSQRGYAVFHDPQSWSFRGGGFPSPRDVVVGEAGNRVYLSVSGEVGVISTETNPTELPAIDLGEDTQPTTLALVGSGAQTRAVTVDERTGALLVIDPANRTVRRLAGVAGATTVAVAPDGESVYLAGPSLPQIVVIDLVSGQQTATIALPSGAGALAYGAEDRLLYATLPGSSALAIVDLTTNEIGATVQLSGTPTQVVHAKGVVFVPLSTAATGADTMMALFVSTTPPVDPDPVGSTVQVGVSLGGAEGLALSVDSGSVDLGAAELSPDLERYTATATLPRVTVLDNRRTDPGWSLVAQAAPFRAGDQPAPQAGLGWRPRVLAADSRRPVVGPEVLPTAGLSTPRTLAGAEPGSGRGSTVLGAELGFEAPSSTKPGNYRTVLTLILV